MAQVGSFVVNTYMNNDNFLAGIKTATAAAKTAEQTIGSSFSRINEKQLKNVMTSGLKTVGIVGAISLGQDIMLATIKGMSDGSVKGMADFGRVAAQATTSVIKGLPVLGNFMQIGEEIGKLVTGVNELESAAAKSREQFEKMGAVLSLLKVSEKTGTTGVESVLKQNAQYGMTEDAIARQDVLSQMQKEDNAANQAYIAMARRSMKDEATDKANGFVDQDIMRKRSLALTEQVAKMEDKQLQKRTAINDQMKAAQEELAGKVSNDLIAKQTAENKLVEDRLELERQLLKEKKDAKEIADWNKEDLAAAEKMAKDTSKNLESATAKNAMPGVDSLATAIGSVKVAGSADFSKQTELLNSAKKANDIASEQLKALRQIVDNSGGTA
jgi:hypothetical protein